MKNNENDNVIRYQKKSRKKPIVKSTVDPEPKKTEDLEKTLEMDMDSKVLAYDDLYPEDDITIDSKGDPMAKKPKKTKNKKKSSILLNILAGFSSLFLLGVLAVAILVGSTVLGAEPLSMDSFEKTDSTIILDANGNVIYDLGEKLVENIEYEDLSQSLIDAFVSIEDSRFFEHSGVDTPRFASAIFMNVLDSLKQRSLSFDAGGASTIDMQLTRNSLFMYEDVETGESQLPASSGISGIQRKILEIYYSTLINNKKILSKKVILQKYVNIANFGVGHNTLGVQKAASYYFDKSASELNLVESAFLAGLVNRPNRITPYYRLSNAKERTNTVLYYMKHHGYIDEEEYQLALSVPLENLFVDQSGRKGEALPNQAYIDVVLNEVKELTDLNPATTGMIIKTSMNPNLQRELDKVQNREIKELDISANTFSPLQLASTILENETGEIIGIIGGYDYYGQRVYNRSYDGLYQPGSTAKPFISYAPAFEYLGYSTDHVLMDQPYYWGGTNILLPNFNNNYRGQVKLIDAVADSLNVPAVVVFDEVLNKIGIEKYREFVASMGFKKHIENSNGKNNLHNQFAIGGAEFYTNTQELAGATATILNGGTYIKPHTIREIIIKDTQEVIESPFKGTPALSDGAAFLTAETMKAVADRTPIMSRLKRSYPIYGKTGTTNWGEEGKQYGIEKGERKDRLLLTGTDRFSMATWTGFDVETVLNPKQNAYFTKHEVNFQLYSKVNKFILDVLDSEYGKGKAIPRPNSVEEITYILGTYPYARPITGMNDSLITKALIKKEAASLVDYTPPTLDSLGGLEHHVMQNMGRFSINVGFTPYPDATKLEVADNRMILTDRSGKNYNGYRLFDTSWIYGSVVYKVDLYSNDQIINSATSTSENITIDLNASPNNNLKVCGYYTFELNQQVRSNAICQNVNTSNVSETVTVPSFNGNGTERGIEQLVNFANQYDIKLNLKRDYTALANYGKITSLNPDLRNQTIAVKQLPKNWNVTFNDVEINVTNYTTSELRKQFGNYINIEGPNGTITSAKDSNGKSFTKFSIYDYYKKTITVSTN